MDTEISISKQKNITIQTPSWIPMKPSVKEPPTVYFTGQDNQLSHENWVRTEEISTVYCDENQATFDSAIFFKPNEDMNVWEQTLTGKLPVTGENVAGVNGRVCKDPNASLDLPRGSKPLNGSTFPPPISQREASIPCHQTYDLNMLPPPETTSDELPSVLVPRFAPITPFKRQYQRNQNKNVLSTTTIQIIDLDPEYTPDSTLPAASTATTDNQNPEKDINQFVIDLNKTPPQQKQTRRRKHRPKVVTIGKPKRVQKPVPDASNLIVKRKYVRKNELEKQAKDNSNQNPIENTAKRSTRRWLNFDLESQEQQFFSVSKVQTNSTVLEESADENAPSEVAYDMVCSINKQLKDYISSHIGSTNYNKVPHEKLNLISQSSKKRQRGHVHSTVHLGESHENNLHFYEAFSGKYFPEIYKKKRTEKGQTSNTSTSSTVNRAPSTIKEAIQVVNMNRVDHFECMVALRHKERFSKKRSKGPIRVKRLTGIAENNWVPNFPRKQTQIKGEAQRADFSQRPPSYIESLVFARKKRSKKQKPVISSVPSTKRILYTPHNFFKRIDPAPEVILNQVLSVDAIIERLKHLDINTAKYSVLAQECNELVPYNTRYQSKSAHVVPFQTKNQQEKNTLVVYKRANTVVPFEGLYYSVKKRRPRPKVNLDEETNRVWQLLLENIDNEGINGSDEQNERWWEGERSVFQGRADSFISRMHLVLGDRRFSKWKGSVLDSVIGVFLTQNVSDHLSSSAFMSLVARFPHKPKSNVQQCYEKETSILVEEPELGVLDLVDTLKWKKPEEKEENEIANINESIDSTICSLSSNNDSISTQQMINEKDDVISPQSSVDSLLPQTDGKIPGTKSTNFDGSQSFIKLLHSFNQINNQENCVGKSDKRLMDAPNQPDSRSQEFDCIEYFEEKSKSCEISYRKDENGISVRSNIAKESSSKAIFEANVTNNVQEFLKTTRDVAPGNNSTADSDITESSSALNTMEAEENLKENNQSSLKKTLNHKIVNNLGEKRKRGVKDKSRDFDWDSLRKHAQANGVRETTADTVDSLDWEAVRCADVGVIADTIKARGMNNMLAERIKDFLNRLLTEHGSLDLEWLRDVPPDKAKEFLLSFRGLGLKSVECVRLLTLHHLAFPVDTNVGRIAVRLGWVPLQPLPESLQLHLLELYPVLESIQKYLWPRLCKLDQKTLYELHYQMITFGKVFCTKNKPNCNACPMRGDCRHFASAFASARLALPAPEEKRIVSTAEKMATADPNPTINTNTLQLPPPHKNTESVENNKSKAKYERNNNEPIIEEPATPEPEHTTLLSESDIEDACFYEDPDEIPTIKLNITEFTQNLQDYMQNNMELQEGEISRALVALTPEAASIPTPKLKNISRLRTEHQVYELPDSHPLLEQEGMDKREPDDPSSYLLAIWTPGETINSIKLPEGSCSSSQENGELCDDATCFSCNSIRESNSQIVRGTLLIPCRTAMRGSFPLNGTYFQVNEVFADHASSLKPIEVPRAWLWNLPRRTVYFGTSIPTIFKGLTTEGIQYCFWRGFVCVRGFEQKTRAPRPLIARLHFPASKLRGNKTNEE